VTGSESGSLELVAFDIETTGFDSDDVVTVLGVKLPLGCRVFCNTGGRPTDGVEARVRDRSERHVHVSMHESESATVEAFAAFASGRLWGEDVLLVAYNGEQWRSGFDLPFLRTRLAALDAEWPFRDLPYADLLPVITNRFNTSVDGESRQGLAGAYDVLVDGELGELDPFDESREAVVAYDEAQFVELVLHNVADVLRTQALGRLAERYCSKSDFRLKSLTPTTHD
jgi:uncharacterized protein YprB with RNaseH-like and TPR domain